MTEPTFTPVETTASIRRDEKYPDIVIIMSGIDEKIIIEQPGVFYWSDAKVLATVYLRAMFHRDDPSTDPFKERQFGFLMETLTLLTGQEDFTMADWADAKYTFAEDSTPQTMYVEVTSTDGYQLTISYMVAGFPWQSLQVEYDAAIPAPIDLYNRVVGNGNLIWVSKGSVLHNGLVYNYDAAEQNIFTSNARITVIEEGGDVLYEDDQLTQFGLINVLLDLHRKLLLKMVYGGLAEMTPEARLKLQVNLTSMLNELFGMGEYTMLADGLSCAVRATVSPEVQCLVTHIYVEESAEIRATWRFFNNMNPWTLEVSEVSELDGQPALASTVYNASKEHIYRALELNGVIEGFGFGEPALEEPVVAPISMIVAAGPNGGIGIGSDLLFRIKEDLQFFRKTTTNHIVIMGRKTFESIGKPLPNRINIILTKDPEYLINIGVDDDTLHAGDLYVATSPEEALLLAQRLNLNYGDNREIFVIGGGVVYNEFISQTSKIYLTNVLADDSHADIHFPLTGSDIEDGWIIEVLNTEMHDEETGLTYSRYVLTHRLR